MNKIPQSAINMKKEPSNLPNTDSHDHLNYLVVTGGEGAANTLEEPSQSEERKYLKLVNRELTSFPHQDLSRLPNLEVITLLSRGAKLITQ